MLRLSMVPLYIILVSRSFLPHLMLGLYQQAQVLTSSIVAGNPIFYCTIQRSVDTVLI